MHEEYQVMRQNLHLFEKNPCSERSAEWQEILFSRNEEIKKKPVIAVRTLEWLFSGVNQLMILQLAIFNLKELCQINKNEHQIK